jgi:hypothetical protein
MADRIVKTLNWRRWSAPLSAVTEATEIAAAEVQEWAQGESEPTVTVEVALPELVMQFGSVREFTEGVPAYELQSLRSVRIGVVARGPISKQYDLGFRYSVSLRLQRADPSLSIEIDGTDRVRIEGLAARLHQVLDHARSGPPIRRDDIVFLLLLIGLWVAGGAIAKLSVGPLLALPVAGVVAIATVIWLFPGLEVMAPGQSSRYQRFRALALAVVVGVIASIVYAVIQKL